MKVIALIINIFLPGVGTLLVGKIGEGLVQIILFWIVAVPLSATMILAIIGVPLAFAVWVWGLVSAVTPKKADRVMVVQESE